MKNGINLYDFPEYPSPPHSDEEIKVPEERDYDAYDTNLCNVPQYGAPTPANFNHPINDIGESGSLRHECLQPPFDNRVDIRSLSATNRSPSGGNVTLEYPDELLRALYQANVVSTNSSVPMIGYSTVTVSQFPNVFVCAEENNKVQPFFNIIGTTMDLRLINELALDRFRSAIQKHFPNLLEGMHPVEVEDKWANANGDIRGKSRLAWWISEEGCLTLSAASPGSIYQLSIRVTAQPLALRIG